jgi:uncharacterized protein YndB with AHSA1/START domain
MTTDPVTFLGAATRTISTRDDGAKVLVATRRYDTSIEDLWDALTSAERIPRWLLPISGELRLGGRYQLEGNAGGEILRCEPPRTLGVTWGMHGQVSWVNVTLAEHPDGGALLRLEHAAHVPPEMWDQFGPGAVGVGWDQALWGLARHLAGAPGLSPAEAGAWFTTAEGRAFAGASSDAWCEAWIASGVDPAAARAAAGQTTAFYTGGGEPELAP